MSGLIVYGASAVVFLIVALLILTEEEDSINATEFLQILVLSVLWPITLVLYLLWVGCQYLETVTVWKRKRGKRR